jgi:hypothetical protein
MSAIESLDKLKLDSISALPPRTLGKAKLVFLQYNGSRIITSTPKLDQAWPVKPVDEGEGKIVDKFTLECRFGDNDTFKNALTAMDMKIRSLAVQNKKLWFGKAADDIETEADLRQMHSMSVRKGSEKADGTRYDDTVKFKVTGWADYVEETLYKGEGDKRYPVDVKWKTRSVDSQGHGGPNEEQTKFYICEGTDMTTGKEKMAAWTPCQDPAGNQIKDGSGNTMWEFVGPKHCQPGCKIRVVFHPSMVWLSSKFGVTLAAKQVFITPAPPKAKTQLEGIEIVTFVDPILASRAAQQAMSSNDLRDLEEIPAEEEFNIEAEPSRKREAEEAVLTSAASSSSAGSPTTKKAKKSSSKTVSIAEEF